MSKGLGSTAGGLVAILFGFLGTFIGSDNLRLALQASTTPQEIRCENLCSNGPGKNAHVTITDFIPLWDDYSVTSTSHNGSWSQVHIPLAPKRGWPRPRPQDGCVVAVINGVHNERELRNRLANGKLTGLIKGKTICESDLDDDDDKPPAEPIRYWQIIEGETPSTVSSAGGMVAGAILLAGLGLFLLVWGRADTTGGRIHRSILFHSPMLLVIDFLSSAFQGSAGSWRKAAIHLGIVGGVVTGIGGHMLVTEGLLSLDGFSFSMGLGSLLVDIGFGLLVLAAYHAIQAWLEPAAVVAACEPAAEQRRPQPKRAGIWLIGLGVGLFSAAFCWVSQGGASANVVAGLIGGAVTCCMIGAYLLFAARAPEVAGEEKGLDS